MTPTQSREREAEELQTRAAIIKASADRFWSKVQKTDSCWLWTASLDRYGYGQIGIGGRKGLKLKAYRFAYELLVGPVPQGLELDHLCRNRACVNPAHLEPVTRRENLLRGESSAAKAARRNHCIRGHEYTPENTRIQIENGRRVRHCRQCQRDHDDARAARLGWKPRRDRIARRLTLPAPAAEGGRG